MPDSPDVADLLQETIAAIWIKRSYFKIDTNFIAWAFKIARYFTVFEKSKIGCFVV